MEKYKYQDITINLKSAGLFSTEPALIAHRQVLDVEISIVGEFTCIEYKEPARLNNVKLLIPTKSIIVIKID